jgi:hypothetical protein
MLAPLHTYALALLGVKSRTVVAGTARDIAIEPGLPIHSAQQIEPRAVGSGLRIVFQFDQPLERYTAVSAHGVTGAPMGSPMATIAGNEITVALGNLADSSPVSVNVTGIQAVGQNTDVYLQTLSFNARASFAVLTGDADRSGAVGPADVTLTKSRSGQSAAMPGDFALDINASGLISAADIAAAKARSGRTVNVGGAVYHVAANGSDSNAGTLAQPWRTIKYAVSAASAAAPGDTIYIKAGRYLEKNIVVAKDHLRVIGYKTVPGDQPAIPANAANPVAPFDDTEMPVIDGQNRALDIGINLRTRRGVTLKNLAVINVAYGILSGSTSATFQENHSLENINVSTTGDLNAGYSGLGISLGSMSTQFANGNRVIDAVIVNAAAEGLTVSGDNNLVRNVKVYCTDFDAARSTAQNNAAATDYYIMVTGSFNVVEDSLVYRQHKLFHKGHGFSIKSNAEQVIDQGRPFAPIYPQFNRFTGNTAINVGEGFVVRHRGVRHNTFTNNLACGAYRGGYASNPDKRCPAPDGLVDADREGGGIVIRDGASFNTFSDTVIENTSSAIKFMDTVEDGDTQTVVGHPGEGNVIERARIVNTYGGVDFNDYSIPSDAGANTIRNSSFSLARFVHIASRGAKQMSYQNNTYSGVAKLVPNPGGYFRGGAFSADVVPSQFSGCTFQDIPNMPPGF